MIMGSFDRQTLAKMEIALEQACGLVSTGSQKHRSRRYIAKRIIECASNGNRDLDSLTTARLLRPRNSMRAENKRARLLDCRITAARGFPRMICDPQALTAMLDCHLLSRR
jgi:hypothetical protein